MSAVQQPVSGRETDAPEPRYLRRIERVRTYQTTLTGVLLVLETVAPDAFGTEPDCGHMDVYQTADGCLRCAETDYVRESIRETQTLANETNGGVR